MNSNGSNMNFTAIHDFAVSCSRLKEVAFLTQNITIPGIQGGSVNVPTSFGITKHPGDRIQYSPLNLDFQVDNNFISYESIYAWLVQANFPHDSNQFSKENLMCDITIDILNSKFKPIKRFVFKNAFPVSVSEISLNTTNTETEYLKASASFEYDYFNMEDL